MEDKKLIDKYGRQLHYLRLSVTDRCNIRCRYCMPEEGMLFAKRHELLSFEELQYLSEVFCGLGVNKIRITGGEPFVRQGIMPFLKQLSTISDLREIVITTNATLIDEYIGGLLQTRIRKINVSLDALDANRFFQITRRDSFDIVYANIFTLLEAGFEVKLNCVLSATHNVGDIIPFIELTKHYPLAVRFLEEMPFNGTEHFDAVRWDYEDIYKHISRHYAVIQTEKNEANSTSINYHIPGYKGTFGIIPSFSRTFCGTCNRIRLSATGELRTCLYGPPAANLRDVLRSGATTTDIENTIINAVSDRLKDGMEAEALRNETVYDSMSVLGDNMHTPNRYIRQQQVPGFGMEAQQNLTAAKVLVVGAGGLGVPALQYLCGMGIGTIGIVDGDTVSITNLHRQVLYNESDIDKKKAIVAAEKLQQLNSSINLHTYDEMLTTANAVDIITQYDVVIDATDNFTARYLINDACIITGKPFVYAAVQGWEAHLSVFNYQDGPTYRCLYPKQPAANEIPDCNTAGVLGVLPGIVGCRQALEAVKIITGIGKPLTGYLKIFDFENDNEYTLKLTANPANKKIKVLQQDAEIFCSPKINNLSPDELYNWYNEGKAFLLVDVRDEFEYNGGHLKSARNIPLTSLIHKKFHPEMPIVLYCKTGNRSQRAATQLKEADENLQVYHTVGGMDNWVATLNNHLIEY